MGERDQVQEEERMDEKLAETNDKKRHKRQLWEKAKRDSWDAQNKQKTDDRQLAKLTMRGGKRTGIWKGCMHGGIAWWQQELCTGSWQSLQEGDRLGTLEGSPAEAADC